MTNPPDRPRALRAVRSLSGESVGLVAGMTFAASERLAEVFGTRDAANPAEVLAAAARALQLDFAFVDGAQPWGERAVELLAEMGVAAFWVVDGPLAHAVRERGLARVIRESVADPGELSPSLDAGVSAASVSAARGFAAGASALVVAEDLAGAVGPLVAPDFVHEELIPRLDSLVYQANSRGLPSLLHSDGDVRIFMPAIARARFAGIHGGGPNAATFMTLLREARRFGLRVVGGIGSEALGQGAEAAKREGAQARLLALPGDLLVADDGGIATTRDLRAFAAALGAVRGDAATGEF